MTTTPTVRIEFRKAFRMPRRTAFTLIPFATARFILPTHFEGRCKLR
jgi:hypothetical protein